VLSLVRERGPVIIIAGLQTPLLVGIYSQAWRLTHVPSGLTSAALRPVFFHRAATQGLSMQNKPVNRIVCLLLTACSPWIGLIVFGHSTLFEILFGAQWIETGRLSAILVVPAALFVVTNWMDRLLDVAGRQDINLRTELVVGLGSSGVLGGTLAAGGSLTLAVALQSVVLTVAYIWFLWVCYGVAGWPRSLLAASLVGAGAGALATFLMLWALSTLFSPAVVILAGVAGIALPWTIAAGVLAVREFE
jgi:hypothetical protein